MYEMFRMIFAIIIAFGLALAYLDYRVEQEIENFKLKVHETLVKPYERLKSRFDAFEEVQEILTDASIPSRLAQPEALELEKEQFLDEHKNAIEYFRGLMKNENDN